MLLAVAAEAWLLAFVAIRGQRRWLQATYAACALAFIVGGVVFVAVNEGLVSRVPEGLALGVLLLAHALTAILVLGLIHGEGLPRERTAAFLLLVPVPVLALLAPSYGWTLANAFGANVLGAFLVLCLGVGLAETIYTRSVSAMFAPHAFWIAVGVIALIVGGPVYAYELLILGLTPLAGANVAAPVALACFARVALRTDPFPIAPRPPRIRPMGGAIRARDAIVFDEVRPKYALRAVHEEATARPTLVIGRRASGIATSGASLATIEPGRHAAERALATASEFLALGPGGLVVCEDLAALAALSGWRSAREAVVRLRHVARGTQSTVILCPSRLTKAEREDLASLDLPTWSLPDPATEIVALLGQSFGAGGIRLVESFSRAQGIRLEDLTTDHVSALLAFVSRALEELSGVASAPAGHGLRVQFEAAASLLRAFAGQGPVDLARGKWPSRAAADRDAEYLVTAAEYWKGKEMDELFAAAEAIVDREPLFEKARSVFVEQLGEAGEGVLRTQLARLGKKPEDLDKRDLVRIADRASVDLESVAEVLDIATEKDRIQRQIESIRQRLELIAEDQE